MTEVVTVEPTYIYLPGDMSIHDDTFIEGWTKLFAEVHKYGCKMLPQLFHPAYMAFPIPGTPRLIAPSNVGPYYAKEAPRAISKEEIKTLSINIQNEQNDSEKKEQKKLLKQDKLLCS